MKGPGRLAVTAATLLAACAHVPVKVADGLAYEERRSRLAALTDWSLRGRIAVVAAEEGFSGRFSWVQRHEQMDLRIRGPLGAGAMAIQGSPQHLTVTARGISEPLAMDDPEQELRAVLGWWVPVSSVPAWLKGIPDDAYPARASFGADGLLERFEQRGWRVALTHYQLVGELLVPARLELEHTDLKLKLIVDRWDLDGLN